MTKILTSRVVSGSNPRFGWSVSEHFEDRDIVEIAINWNGYFYLDSNGITYDNTQIGRQTHQLFPNSKQMRIYHHLEKEQSTEIGNDSSIERSKTHSQDEGKLKQKRISKEYEENKMRYVHMACGCDGFWAIDRNGEDRKSVV